MNFSIVIIWMSPLSFWGHWEQFYFIFFHFLKKVLISKQNNPRLDTKFCGVKSGVVKMPMSHKYDMIRVKSTEFLNVHKNLEVRWTCNIIVSVHVMVFSFSRTLYLSFL